MSFIVQIARIGADGLRLGSPTTEALASESDALAVMRKAIQRGMTLTQPLEFSVYGPDDQLLLSYTSNTADQPHGAAAAA